jgi:hypothetical protein
MGIILNLMILYISLVVNNKLNFIATVTTIRFENQNIKTYWLGTINP